MKKIAIAVLLSIAAKQGFCKTVHITAGEIPWQKMIDTPRKGDTANTKMQDYVTVQGGKVLIVKGINKAKPIEEDITMHDGSVVRRDGTLITKDGKTFVLHEGDKVYMSGIIEAPKLE